MRVIYPGPSEAVRILATGQVATRGEPVDVPATLGRQLVRQGWEKPADPPKPKQADKAKEKK